MAALIVGSCLYFAIFVVSAYLISDHVTKDVVDEKLRDTNRK
jgi:hypothetical protein